MTIARAVRARLGCRHCGDALASWQVDNTLLLCVVDGLGHGPDAEEAARASIAYVAKHQRQPLLELFSGCDRSVSSTRGVAMGIARIVIDTQTIEYAGVGNTRAMLVCGDNRRYLVSSPGIVGGGFRRLQIEQVKLTHKERLFLYTDGFPRRLDRDDFLTRLTGEEPQRLADALLRGLGEERDDNALLIYEYARPGFARDVVGGLDE